ncbi:MAG: hypothetical protein IPJ03_18480 [Ignavibacteriales bacterium]|nr:hypothetical protein [Ignavibacteriales bacterium]
MKVTLHSIFLSVTILLSSLIINSCNDESTNFTESISNLSKTSGKLSNGATVGSWYSLWDNNGNGYLGPWQMNISDKYIMTPDHENILAISSAGYASNLWFGISISGYEFSSDWDNNGNGYIGAWQINSSDKFSFIQLGLPHNTLLAVSPGYWSALIQVFTNGTSEYWNNGGNGNLGSWVTNSNDKFLAANWFQSYPNDELLVVNYPWASILRFNSGSWSTIWNNNGNGKLGNWTVSLNDQYLIDDFDGDGLPELLCIATNGTYSSLLEFNGVNWITLWTNGGNNYIGSWQKATNDKYASGLFDNLGVQDMFLSANSTSHFAALQKFSGSSWTLKWSNNGSGYIHDWQISSGDKFMEYYFSYNLDNKKYILCLNSTWAALKRWSSMNSDQ